MTTTLYTPIASENELQPYHWTVEAYQRAWDAGVFGHDAKLELVSGRVIERCAEGGPTDYHWTADAFEQASEAGVFGHDVRLELLNGRVIDRMPESTLHGFLAMLIVEYLRALFPSGFLVRAERLIRIAFDGDPIPDISVVIGGPFDYRDCHATPQDTALLVEIAVSSVEYDLGSKALLYSKAGIEDYWVVMPNEKIIVVHRQPTQNGYTQVIRLGEDDSVSPLAATEASLPVRSLLGL
jgi:Uma2 family endonuclease